jgi:hypothetical protein
VGQGKSAAVKAKRGALKAKGALSFSLFFSRSKQKNEKTREQTRERSKAKGERKKASTA